MSLTSGCAGERHHQRADHAVPDALSGLQHVLRALRGLVLDEVRLVDDHAAEPERPQPADVAVEDLVVDDHDVGEAVDVVAVTVHHRGHAVRRPQRHLAGPVGLHDVRDDDEQRVGVGGLGGEQRLGGLAEAGLVGQQEGAVSGHGRGHDLRLVVHQLASGHDLQGARLGQLHAGRRPALLEGPEQGPEQLPAVQVPGASPALGRRLVVRLQERVGELAGADRDGDDAARRRQVGGRLGLGRLLGRLEPGVQHHLAPELAGVLGDGGVLGEQPQQGGVAGRDLGEDRGDAVQPLELLGAEGLADVAVGLDAGPLLTHEQGHDLELGAATAADRPALGLALDLAHGLGEHGQQPLVVRVLGGATTVAGAGARRGGCALASCGQGLLLRRSWALQDVTTRDRLTRSRGAAACDADGCGRGPAARAATDVRRPMQRPRLPGSGS